MQQIPDQGVEYKVYPKTTGLLHDSTCELGISGRENMITRYPLLFNEKINFLLCAYCGEYL